MTREQLKYCGSIIKQLKRHRDAAPFLLPVDPVALKIPDYPQIVKKPMDLSTAERKLNNIEYDTADEFVTDINLIFSNCYLYNGREAPVSLFAANLESIFINSLRHMPKEGTVASLSFSSFDDTEMKEPPKNPPAPPKPKKEHKEKNESTKKEEKKKERAKKEPKVDHSKKEDRKEPSIIPITLSNPSAVGVTSFAPPGFVDPMQDMFDDRRPKRDIHAPSREITVETSPVKRKGSVKWKTDPQLRFCQGILREFMKKANAEFMFPFLEPVDWVALSIPDYPRIVKNPMDISTIRQKLEKDEYQNSDQFESDVRLLLRNCFLFNPAGTPVHMMGRRMEQLFDQKWPERPLPPSPPPPPPKPEPQPEDVTIDSSEDEVAYSDDKIAEMERRLKTLSEQLKSMKATKKKDKGEKKPLAKPVQDAPPPKPTASQKSTPKKAAANHSNNHSNNSVSAKKKPSVKRSKPVYTSSDEEDRSPSISFEQKKELSEAIHFLEGEKLAKVVQIIHESMPHLRDNGGQDEIELDMDSLDPKTLHKLYHFVTNNTKHKRRKVEPTPVRAQYTTEDATKRISELEQTLQRFHQPAQRAKETNGRSRYSSSSSGTSSSSGSDSDDSGRETKRQVKSTRRPSPQKSSRRSSTSAAESQRVVPGSSAPAAPTAPTATTISTTATPVATPKRAKNESTNSRLMSPPPSTKNAESSPHTHSRSQSQSSQPARASMSFDVASLDIDATDLSNKARAKGDPDHYLNRRGDDATQLENMEHWAAFTASAPAQGSQSALDDTTKKADPAWDKFQREIKAKKEQEQLLREEQLRKERDAREENERKREEERKRQEVDQERKKEIAREAFLREQKRSDEIQQRRLAAKERNQRIRDSGCAIWDQTMIMQEYELEQQRECREQMYAREERLRRLRIEAKDRPLSERDFDGSPISSSSSSIGTPRIDTIDFRSRPDL
ncbi:hypothetical protein BGW38_004527, partial [Lunasporangiospora selenospora]